MEILSERKQEGNGGAVLNGESFRSLPLRNTKGFLGLSLFIKGRELLRRCLGHVCLKFLHKIVHNCFYSACLL